MNDEQLLRYSRHLLLPKVDIDGQQKILAARVLIIGLGGLGSPVCLYLAAAGVGELVLVDDDHVDLTNLQRQIAHKEALIGTNKAESAANAAKALNSDIVVTCINKRLEKTELIDHISAAHVVVDCTDNLATRLLINAVCWEQKTPLVSGAAIGFEGQLMVVEPSKNTPCYRCLYDESADAELNCSESGVIAPLVGVIGSMQALETLKLLAEIHENSGKLTLFDGMANRWQSLNLPKLPDCPVCSART